MSDLRLPLLGVGAWLGGLGAAFLPGWSALLLAVAALAIALGTRSRVLVAGSLAGLAVLGVATLRVAAFDHGPVADLVAGRAVVDARVDISSDPRVVPGRFGDIVVVRGVLTRVSGRGAAYALRAPVVVLADEGWLDLRLGSSVDVT